MLQRMVDLAAATAGTVAGTVVGLAGGVVDVFSMVGSGIASASSERAHLPVRGVHADADAAAGVERAIERHPGVRRAEVNGVLGSVMVEFDAERVQARHIAEIVRTAEEECGLAAAPRSRHEHPGHPARALREAALLGLHTAGLAYTTVGRAVPLPPVAFLGTVASLIDSTPRLRALLVSAFGESVTDVVLNDAAAISNAVGKRPVGLVADACQRYVLHREAHTRRKAWIGWEGALASVGGGHRAAPVVERRRPVILPPGPVEKTTDRAALLAVGVSILLLGLAAPTPPAGAALAAGVPKAAQAGRQAFAARVGRDLAERGSLLIDPAALRRLDRVSTIVLDADVLCTGRHVVDEVEPVLESTEREMSELVERVHDLVDLRRPMRRRTSGGWSVEPVGHTRAPTARIREAAAELGRRAPVVLALRRDGALLALVGVGEELDPYAEAIVAAAGRAGLVLVAGSRQLARRLDADGEVAGGADLADAVASLQRDGHVVGLVSRDAAALDRADLAIGFVPGRAVAPPWTADVLCSTAAEVCLVLDAVDPAASTSRRAAQLAVAGSALGGVLALLGPPGGASGRATVAVHTAALLAFGYGTWSGSGPGRRPAPVPSDRTPWHAMSTRAVLEVLGSSGTGLTEQEARRRHGERPAAADESEVGILRASMEELANPVTPALGAGAGISAAMGSLLDPLLILGVLAVSALIGGGQRVGAQRALRTLRHGTATRVRVRRHDSESERRSDELVRGDLVRLHAGDAVPADCRVLTAHDLEVDESSLTGESIPVRKSPRASSARAVADRRSMLYEGTVVAAGRGTAVVVATGGATEVGRSLRRNGEEAPPTGVEVRLRELTARVLPLTLGAGALVIGIDLLRRRPPAAALTRAVGLAVAAVPEGLPFVATVAELAAARRLSGRGALVRNSSTIEALGRVTALCFDKTGTLTEGRISLRRVSDGTRTVAVDDDPLTDEMRDVVAVAVRASPFRAAAGQVTHQTDRAVLRGAERLGIAAENGHAVVEQIDELPFETHRGYHATLWQGRSGGRISVKGAPEVVLPLCTRRLRNGDTSTVDDRARAEIDAEVHRLALGGHRVLAVAQRRVSGLSRLAEADVTGLEFRGLVALVDPVRPTAARSVAALRAAGVEIAMITGDHPSTAQSIAADLDLLDGRGVLTGADLDRLDDAQLGEAMTGTAVYARVTPAQKARIVRVLQQAGHAVAVTGDGANDAAAIRLADVGIALGSRATPAAREAADVVITDDRIETLTDAVVEGRGMWASVRDALSILLGGNLGEVAYTVGTGLVGGPGSLNARQLLLINMLTDVLPAMAVAVRPPPDVSAEKLLAEGPDRSLGGSLIRDIAVRASITALAAGAAWLAARPVSTPGQAGTTGLVALVGAQLGQTLAVRGRTPLVALAVAASVALLALAVQTPGISHVVGSRPLLPHQWGIAVVASLAATVAQLLAQRVTDRTGAGPSAAGHRTSTSPVPAGHRKP
ncbi:cation-translocating P-type ATPase [Pseudonocardia sp. RS11V-5]|uniref:cation-translocating P-type ATPase n=1 Tax=Pseudonocardia terrae TaxID=2905831 RepID=UPI001E47F2BC|nr:cation-translocating P-type ATPase [Pseudonocardia terrae]MCE3551353.1 cation-translocating P-type ATPase [Pseudonocardia terrae]